jgi:hypothetical protein
MRKRDQAELVTWYQDYDRDFFGDGEKVVAAERPADFYFSARELEAATGTSLPFPQPPYDHTFLLDSQLVAA